jgi:outer membrane protein assembly factor BamB
MSAEYQIYVTFSGEQGTKIQCVTAVSPADGSVLGPVTGNYDELRGIALDQAGRLYVAVAYQGASAVDVFSATVTGTCSRALLQTLLWPPSSQPAPSPVGLSPAIGLDHPYGLTVAPSPTALAGAPGTVFVSSQDTNVVCAYSVQAGATMTATPVATASALASYGSTFYPGTIAASQTGIPVTLQQPPSTITPPNVAAPLGLSLNFDASGHVEDAPDASGAAVAKKKKSKHSVRGVLFAGDTLYVADENGDRVVCYDPSSGTVQQEITKTHDTKSQPNAIGKPVGLAYDPVKEHVYIGSPGKTGAIFAYHVKSGHLHLVVSSASNTTYSDALDEVSGLAVAPDGTLIFGSRNNQKLYTVSSSGTIAELTSDLGDEPECLLVVPAS